MSIERPPLPPSVVAAARVRRSRPAAAAGSSRAYPPPAAPHDPEATAVRLAATRALLTARSPQEVAAVVATLVHDLGGGLLPARLDVGTQTLPLDVSLGLSEPTLAWAESPSVAALRLESVLPSFLEDARVVLSRLQAEALRARRDGSA